MMALKRKRMYEAQVAQMQQQSFNLEQTSFAISTAKESAEVVKTMQQATVDLKAEYKSFNVDKVEDVQDDLDDLLQEAEEINEVMGRGVGAGAEVVDDDDLLEELAALDELDLGAEEPSLFLPSAEEAGELPVAPEGGVTVPAAATPSAADAARAPADGIPTDEFGMPKVTT